MSWWYENEVEEMKLYKNEDLCIECKNEFFSKPYDHRDPTPGQLGYCIKCDNCLIQDRKMEFDNSRLYTCVNATELHIGDKVYVGNDLAFIKDWWRHNCHTDVLTEIRTDGWERRFGVEREGEIEYFALAYLVERAENCTNCGSHEVCGYVQNVSKFACLNRCENYKPKTEKEDNMWNYEGLPERQEMGVSDRVVVAIEGYNIVDIGYYDYDLEGWFVEGCRYPVRVYAWMEVKPPKEEA